MPLGYPSAVRQSYLSVGKAELVEHAVDVIGESKPGGVGVAAQIIERVSVKSPVYHVGEVGGAQKPSVLLAQRDRSAHYHPADCFEQPGGVLTVERKIGLLRKKAAEGGRVYYYKSEYLMRLRARKNGIFAYQPGHFRRSAVVGFREMREKAMTDVVQYRRKAQKAQPVPRAIQAQRVRKVPQDRQALKEMRATRVRRVRRDQQVPQVPKVKKEQRVPRAIREQPAPKVRQDRRVPQDLRDPQVQRYSALRLQFRTPLMKQTS